MIESSIIHHVLWFPRANSRFFGVTGKKRTMFLVPTLDPALVRHSHSIRHSFQHSVLHKNGRRVGGYGIGGQCWANREHGFCLSLSPPATELQTTQFQLSKEGDYWLALFYLLGHHLLYFAEIRSGSTLLWPTTWVVSL
jgi:hypothetical protein